jgi:DNA-binding transcriptional LysR family regulator
VALASTWLVPRLPRFAKLHPDIDLRLIATNDKVGLTREHIDVAIRFATLQMPAPTPDKLFDYKMFPVCAPSLARRRTPPLRTARRHPWLALVAAGAIVIAARWPRRTAAPAREPAAGPENADTPGTKAGDAGA